MQKLKNSAPTGLGLIFMLCLTALTLQNCKKYKDPNPIKIDTFSRHYCNIYQAVNYNWGFPGVADNSVCFFASDVFKGLYTFYDSLQDANGIFLPNAVFSLNITKQTDSTILISGLCSSSLQIKAHATKNLRFSIDTLVPQGQVFCNVVDTINGLAIKKNYTDSAFTFSYNLITPTGLQMHKGTIFKN